MPLQGHLEAAYNIFGYLYKQADSTLVFDNNEPRIDKSVFEQVDWSDTPYKGICCMAFFSLLLGARVVAANRTALPPHLYSF